MILEDKIKSIKVITNMHQYIYGLLGSNVWWIRC